MATTFATSPLINRLPQRRPAQALRRFRLCSTTRLDPPTTLKVRASSPLARLASAALSIAAVRRMVMAAARRKFMRDAKSIGIDWEGDVDVLRNLIDGVLQPRRDALAKNIAYPAYYSPPFLHAYERGNLGWLPALEAEVLSRAVSARHSTTSNPLDGDGCLRGRAAQIVAERWAALYEAPPQKVLDVGCSVGLSTVSMRQQWPGAVFMGVDASAEMLSVAAYRYPELQLVHGLGESMPSEWSDSFDVVYISFVVHELPDDAFQAILYEARRVLRPGGLLAVMDVNPAPFQKMPAPILVLFLSTEACFDQHIQRSIPNEIMDAGFVQVCSEWNTEVHQTHTAIKSTTP